MMANKATLNLSLRYKILFGFVTVILLLFGVILVAQGLIHTDRYRQEIARIIHEQTGQDVIIKGPVRATLLPTQTLYVSGVELRDASSDASGPSLTVDMMRIDITLLSALSDHPHITSISLQRPALELTRTQNGVHWGWLNTHLLQSLADQKNFAAHPGMTISASEGKITYYDRRNDKATTIDAIQAYATTGHSPSLQSTFAFAGHTIHLTLDGHSGAAAPLNLKLSTDTKNMLQWQGSADLSGDIPKFTGKMQLELENILVWIGNGHRQEEEAFDPLALIYKTSYKASQPKEVPLPIKLSGDWSQEGINVTLTNARLEGIHSTGKGTMALAWNGSQPDFKANMAFSSLNYDQWRIVGAAFFNTQSSSASPSYGGTLTPSADNPLPKNIQIDLTLAADQLQIGSQVWQKAQISVSLAEATLTVNQFHLELADEARLNLFGVISQGTTGGLRFEGSIETSGKSLRHLLTIFDDSASDLPETGFGDFYMHSNIFVSSEQMRLSEADVKLSDLKLGGGLVAYFDSKNPRLEADVRLKEINFDYFRDIWRAKQKLARTQQFFLQFDKASSFNWLKKLQPTIDLRVSVDGFTFLERKGDSASFRLFVRQNEFGIYDILFNYPGETTTAGFKLDVKGDQPYVDVTFNTDELDTSYFTLDGASMPPPDSTKTATGDKPAHPPGNQSGPDIEWSQKLFDMGWMEGFNGSFNLSVGKLTYGKMLFSQIKMQAKLDHDLLNFQNLNFDYWQGRCSVLGSLYGGRVPGLSISYTLSNADLSDMTKALVKRDNVSGKVNISGTLTTSGVNPLSWVQQADAKILMNGAIHVQGVNMQGVVDAVGVSRTAADVFNNVNRSLVEGATDFEINGGINIKNAVMQTPGISLKTGAIAGNFRGELNLISWTMSSSTLFQFPALASDNTPTLTVQLVGPFDAPELRTDTSSLEAYVTGHIKGG